VDQEPHPGIGRDQQGGGLPDLSPRYRHEYRRLGFQDPITDPDLKAAIARRVIGATIQPAATFMNALRDRLAFAKRAGGRSSRTGDTYINSACYNPRVLAAVLNIYRTYYNCFEPRQYVSPINKHQETDRVARGITSLEVPGSSDRIVLPKRRRLAPVKRTPAMRAGLHQVKPGEDRPKPPDLSRVLYKPWFFHGTPLWAKLQGR
jgi:hypothetical protein